METSEEPAEERHALVGGISGEKNSDRCRDTLPGASLSQPFLLQCIMIWRGLTNVESVVSSALQLTACSHLPDINKENPSPPDDQTYKIANNAGTSLGVSVLGVSKKPVGDARVVQICQRWVGQAQSTGIVCKRTKASNDMGRRRKSP